MVRAWLNGIIALAVIGLLAWGPEHSQRELKSGRIPIIFWHMWNEKEWKDAVERIVKRFNDSQTEYEVIPLAVPPDDAETKFLLADSGGDPPDLVSQWMPILGVWSDRGLVQPVEDVMTPPEKAQFYRESYPIIKRHAVYKGKIMAIIAGVDVHAVYYRLDDLKEVGRDENHLPQTLEELTELGHQLDRRDADGRLRRVGFLPQNFENFAPSFGPTYTDDGPIDMKCSSNLAALNYIYGEEKRLGFDNVTRFISSQPADVGINAPMISGNFSIVLDGRWRVKQIDTYAPDLKYTVGPLPPPQGGLVGGSYTNANLLLIPRGTKHALGAWKFMKFWIGFDDPEVGSVNVADMAWLPYGPKVAAAKGYQAYLKKYPKFRPFLDLMSSPNLATPPSGPLEAYILDQMQQANDAVNHGSATPAEALDKLDESVKKEAIHQRGLGHG